MLCNEEGGFRSISLTPLAGTEDALLHWYTSAARDTLAKARGRNPGAEGPAPADGGWGGAENGPPRNPGGPYFLTPDAPPIYKLHVAVACEGPFAVRRPPVAWFVGLAEADRAAVSRMYQDYRRSHVYPYARAEFVAGKLGDRWDRAILSAQAEREREVCRMLDGWQLSRLECLLRWGGRMAGPTDPPDGE